MQIALIIWGVLLVGSLSIGGFFMFRKFLKLLPKSDGKSTLDWQNYYVEQSRSLWDDESKEFLDLLVLPVPKAFRDNAKHTIAAKIAQLALEEEAVKITREHCLKGYILATPKQDHNYLKRFLTRRGVDYSPYEHLFELSPK